MAFSDLYRRQVSLLVRILPYIVEEDCFALKGGTAINLFVRDLPRLSVDIDLTYLPIHDRQESLKMIHSAMERIADRVVKGMPGIELNRSQLKGEGICDKLFAKQNDAQVKIEVTPVLRGCVYEPELRTVTPRVEDEFGFAEMRIVSFADLYAGKIVAAMDRQHPRDFFDVRALLADEGIDERIRTAFVVYLASHHGSMAAVLDPKRKDMTDEFERGFDGMTEEPVSLNDLEDARERLIEAMVGEMPRAHREFLVSFKTGNPDWGLLNLDHAHDLPAIKWKMLNLDKLDPDKRTERVEILKGILNVTT